MFQDRISRFFQAAGRPVADWWTRLVNRHRLPDAYRSETGPVSLGQWLSWKYAKRRRKLEIRHARLLNRHVAPIAHFGRWGPLRTLARTWLSLWLKDYAFLPLARRADGSVSIGHLAPACDFQSVAPTGVGKESQMLRGTFPALEARRFTAATVMGTSSAVQSNELICVPDLYISSQRVLITDGAFLVSQSRDLGVLRIEGLRPLEKGIAVFGSGATNWYHWLIEILPAAHLAARLLQDLQNLPLLVPAKCLQIPQFREALDAVTQGRAVVALDDSVPYRVGDLVVIDDPVRGPMNLVEGAWPVVSDYAQNADVMRRYRAGILDHFGISPPPPDRRLFLARDATRRSYNQTEILAIAERHGFEAVYPEKMSFRDQVAMYASASFLAGPSGAAFANMLFCQPGTQGLTWILPQYDQFCAFSNLAAIVGLDLRYLFVTPDTEVKSSFDAYSATSTLDPSAFEASLAAMLEAADPAATPGNGTRG